MILLMVDDSQIILKHAEGILIRSDIPLEIHMRQSGERALEYVRENPVDIVLTDIIMPGMGGMELLKSLKHDPAGRGIDVLMFSSLSDKETLHECFELGASDFITKPIDELEFLARIKSAVRKKSLEKAGFQYLKAIEDQNRTLRELNERLQTAQNQMIQQEKMASVGHLAAGVAHEINNPLGFVTSNFATLKKYVGKYHLLTELASAMSSVVVDCDHEQELKVTLKTLNDFIKKNNFDFINEDINELFKDTQEGLERVGRIVRGLRNFSRIDQAEELSSYNLNEGIENTLIISRNEMKYAAEVEMDLNPVPDILASGGQINQVILNILMNAISAIKQSHPSEMGMVRIRTWADDSDVCVSISDNGAGIQEEHLKDIFNPFFTTKPVGEGTGLGLSISYDIIVNKHKGTILVDSTPGVGTQFTLKLPTNMENLQV